ncbi:IPT/TIG domain-containing protein [Streptomyces collinus]|uniref:IPT/TIG domain-containing protein n=1 Tax=Streptomyces collinus TaxID=42684 RepID=UPI0037909869
MGTTSGPPAGGNTITINGTGLSTATGVDFGGVTTTPTGTSDSSLSVTVPAGAAAGPVSVSVTTAGGTNNGPVVHLHREPDGTAGAVDVVVTSPAGSDTAVGGFTYVAGPGI